jgi:hypothetical protein
MNKVVLQHETIVYGKRLGRHVEHDHRSRGYEVTTHRLALANKVWNRDVPAFDQGDLGSCTGNAMAGVLVSEPFFEKERTVDEHLAVLIYSAATRLDYISGHYPPEDTGSSGLAVAKVSHKLGYISGYRHAFSLRGCLSALSYTGPVIIGLNWYDSFDSPVGMGAELSISPNASVRGGHEVELLGIDIDTSMIFGINSWGSAWGNGGRFSMSFDTLERLLEERGDVVVPLR